jgi:pyruvate dehydrogenase E1 component beta subunit
MQTYFSHTIRDTLAEEMERDGRVILLGEDIAGYGGAFKITHGFAERFGPERVRNTPIAEGGFMGVAVGAAMTGLRPVVEIMFADFVTLALDQLVNHAAKFAWMYNGQVTVPLVVRLPSGAGRGYGPTHSQSMERFLCSTPGLRVVAPSDPAEARGLLRAAIRCDEPVCFLESKILYGMQGEVPEGDYVLPLDQARIVRPGRHVTIVAYSRMTQEALRAAEALAERGVEAEVVDLRSLAPLDIATVAESVTRTGRVVVVEEGSLTGGIGAEVVARIVTECFDYLDAPPVRVAAADTPIPAAPALERLAIPSAQEIARAVVRLVGQAD